MSLVYNTPLSPAQQVVAGLDPVQPFAVADRVRFSELDPLNHVNNTAYFEWFERLRVLYAMERGLSNYREEEDNPRIVIRSGEVHFRQETHLGEDYIATCACRAFRTSSFSLSQQIWAGGRLRATFDCVMVTLEPDGSQKRPLPTAVQERFERLDGATKES